MCHSPFVPERVLSPMNNSPAHYQGKHRFAGLCWLSLADPWNPRFGWAPVASPLVNADHCPTVPLPVNAG